MTKASHFAWRKSATSTPRPSAPPRHGMFWTHFEQSRKALLEFLKESPFLSAQEPKLPADLKKVAVADGVELHYVEKGKWCPSSSSAAEIQRVNAKSEGEWPRNDRSISVAKALLFANK